MHIQSWCRRAVLSVFSTHTSYRLFLSLSYHYHYSASKYSYRKAGRLAWCDVVFSWVRDVRQNACTFPSLCFPTFNTRHQPAINNKMRNIISTDVTGIPNGTRTLSANQNNEMHTDNVIFRKSLLQTYCALPAGTSFLSHHRINNTIQVRSGHSKHVSYQVNLNYQSNPSKSPAPFRAEVSWIDHCLFLMSGRPRASET